MFDGILYQILIRKIKATESDGNQQNDNHGTGVESSKHAELYMNDVMQTANAEMIDPGPHAKAEAASTEMKSPAPQVQMEGAATEMKNPAPLESSLSEEVILPSHFSL